MDLASRLQQLEDMVREAKSMPLSSSVLISREEFLELLEEMKASLPEEIRQARWVVKDREELLAKGRRDAEAIVEEARREQLRMASREAVVEKAEQEAARIISEAEVDGRRIRLEADDYVDAKLAQFEIVLQKLREELVGADDALGLTLEQIRSGRERLRGVAPAEQEFAQRQPSAPFDVDEPAGDA